MTAQARTAATILTESTQTRRFEHEASFSSKQGYFLRTTLSVAAEYGQTPVLDIWQNLPRLGLWVMFLLLLFHRRRAPADQQLQAALTSREAVSVVSKAKPWLNLFFKEVRLDHQG